MYSQTELNAKLCAVFEGAGYRRYKMSKFEEYDLYARNKDFLISENVLTFTDIDGKLMALKPDVTLSIVKNTRETEGVEKVYYHENVYRASGVGFREIAQAGLECIGEVDDYCVCEVLSLATKSLLAISRRCELDISHLGLLCEFLDSAGLSGSAKKRAIDLMGGKNRGELEKLLREEDISADITTRIMSLAEFDSDVSEASPKLRWLLGGFVSEDRLNLFCETCEFLGNEFSGTVRVDFSTVGDLSYYSGIIFKGYVDGVPSDVLSGGQYDGLMKKLKKPSRAIGFALYLDMLEPLFESGSEYDADVLLVYGVGMSPKEIYDAAKELSKDGRSVSVRKTVPKNMAFKEIYKLEKGGAAKIE